MKTTAEGMLKLWLGQQKREVKSIPKEILYSPENKPRSKTSPLPCLTLDFLQRYVYLDNTPPVHLHGRGFAHSNQSTDHSSVREIYQPVLKFAAYFKLLYFGEQPAEMLSSSYEYEETTPAKLPRSTLIMTVVRPLQ